MDRIKKLTMIRDRRIRDFRDYSRSRESMPESYATARRLREDAEMELAREILRQEHPECRAVWERGGEIIAVAEDGDTVVLTWDGKKWTDDLESGLLLSREEE